MKKTLTILSIFFLFSFFNVALSGPGGTPLADIEIPQDESSVKRGFTVYYDSCRMCHGLKYIRYRNLSEIGFSNAEINTLRGERLKTEALASTSSNDSLQQLYGLIPPDLSLMAKARKKGPQYIYTLLTQYYEKSDNVYDNKFSPRIRMPDVFSYSLASNAEEKLKIEKKIRDVTAFLVWASDPRAQERKSLGRYVMAYLILLSVMFYFVMKRVWRRLDA